MALGGAGRNSLIIMWALTIVTFAFVVFRAYTRIVIIKSYGIEDHTYNLAFVSKCPQSNKEGKALGISSRSLRLT
jgi:hypothetical protein